jgi:hypothetical protein
MTDIFYVPYAKILVTCMSWENHVQDHNVHNAAF